MSDLTGVSLQKAERMLMLNGSSQMMLCDSLQLRLNNLAILVRKTQVLVLSLSCLTSNQLVSSQTCMLVLVLVTTEVRMQTNSLAQYHRLTAQASKTVKSEGGQL